MTLWVSIRKKRIKIKVEINKMTHKQPRKKYLNQNWFI